VETVNAFMVVPPALPSEQDVNPPVTVMHAGFRDLADTQAQRTVTGRHRTVAERTAADLQRKTDLPFAGPRNAPAAPGPIHAAVPASGLFCRHVLQHRPVGAQTGHPFLQPQVFLFRLTHVLPF